MRMRRIGLLLSPLVVMALLAGCGDDSESSSGATATDDERASVCPAPGGSGTPTVPPGGTPERIVSLSATATEMLYAIGAGEAVVAVDDQSNYPAEAPKTDLSGYTPNVEAITNYSPDLVIAQDDLGGLVTGLSAVDVEVLLLPSAKDLGDSFDQIAELGAVTDNIDAAEQVIRDMCSEIDALLAGVPEREAPLTYYHELDNTLYTATEGSFIGQVYSLLGLQNIAPDDPSGYVQLAGEAILDADPDLIFLADTKCCGQTAETLADREGWAALTAVANRHVVELDDDIASRWGPRIVDLMREVAEAVQELEPAGVGSSD